MRIRKPLGKPITIRLRQELYAPLIRYCRTLDVEMSTLIRSIVDTNIDVYLKPYVKGKKNESTRVVS